TERRQRIGGVEASQQRQRQLGAAKRRAQLQLQAIGTSMQFLADQIGAGRRRQGIGQRPHPVRQRGQQPAPEFVVGVEDGVLQARHGEQSGLGGGVGFLAAVV